jgi:nitrogen fixation protein FixH
MMKSGKLWPWGLGLVLAVTVAGNIWMMRVAGSDPSFAIEPDYYRKAVEWDSTVAQSVRNQALGWRLSAMLGAPAASGSTVLVATLRDANGEPVTGAAITVEATHNARATEILTAELAPAEAGSYRATLPAARRGIWELRFEVERGAERFTATLRADNTRSPAS